MQFVSTYNTYTRQQLDISRFFSFILENLKQNNQFHYIIKTTLFRNVNNVYNHKCRNKRTKQSEIGAGITFK